MAENPNDIPPPQAPVDDPNAIQAADPNAAQNAGVAPPPALEVDVVINQAAAGPPPAVNVGNVGPPAVPPFGGPPPAANAPPVGQVNAGAYDPLMYETLDLQETPEGAERARQHLSRMQLKLDIGDPERSFKNLEDTLSFYGISSQRFKRQALMQTLTSEALEAARPESQKSFAEALAETPSPYKALKDKLLEVFGPDPVFRLQRFTALTMTSTPSDFLQRLMETMKTRIQCDECRVFIYSAWMAGVPPQVRTALAQQPVLTPANRLQLTEMADRIYKSVVANRPQQEVFAVEVGVPPFQVAAQAAARAAADQRAAQQPGNFEVAAVNRFRGGGAAGGAAGGASGGAAGGASGGNKKDKKRKSGFPWDEEKGICGKHSAFGVNAKACSDPARCPLVHLVKPDQN